MFLLEEGGVLFSGGFCPRRASARRLLLVVCVLCTPWMSLDMPSPCSDCQQYNARKAYACFMQVGRQRQRQYHSYSNN